MKLLEIWKSFFPDRNDSRNIVKDRLRLILAQDRCAVPAEVLTLMRAEILAVVSRYFEIAPEGTEINLETDDRTTVLIANLPIVRVKPLEPAKEVTVSFVLDLN
ncbi:MAG: cell division topological specificity factor MinE [Cyanobacteria bacterium M5B4]|nr:cell division topological specificity factor MinE [Cyanobacteria bacterium KgW148]PLS67856.1 MAG: cell division topological specificity factor MinE [Cyanobacteria bacterium M5B4]